MLHSTHLLWSWILVALGSCYVIQSPGQQGNNTSPPPPTSHLLDKRATDPADFSWVKRWAAVGDSFTAGIGSGRQLGKAYHRFNDWKCSRYDQAYPMVVNTFLGRTVQKFQYPACSGDRSEGIYKQVTETLEDNMDLVLLTAGGNDLCLASMIKKCVFFPYDDASVCEEVISKAEENTRTILKPNLVSILEKLNDKMAKDSIVVYNGYAQFFNTDDEETCTKKQDFGWSRVNPKHFNKPKQPLDIARRKRLNSLVIAINNVIKDAIEDVKKNNDLKYKIGFADWDRWVYEGVRGQYCDPQGEGKYPDPKQPDLQFFKPDTKYYDEWRLIYPVKRDLEGNELTEEEVDAAVDRHIDAKIKREEQHMKNTMYDSLLWKSASPAAVALHQLDRRAPSPPNCPGDGDFDPTLGLGLPDTFGKNFHPNELGHQTIASFALDRAMKLRAEILGQDPACKIADEFHCWQKEGSKAYAHVDYMSKNIEDFCNNKVKQPEHSVGWSFDWSYHVGSLDEHNFKVELSPQAVDFKKDECLDSFKRIVHGCDGNDPENPMNWKFGGKWVRGEYTYSISVKRDNRPWPPIKVPYGDCKTKYKLMLTSVFLHGAGFATADFGQDTLKKSVASCIGSTPSSWKFWYYDAPDGSGLEWACSFNTPVFTGARCFGNEKAVKGAGGHTGGCSGSG